MNEITVFNNTEFGSVRTIEVGGEPYFVGKDVTDILGYSNARDALINHVDEDDKNTVAIYDGNKGNPNQTIINESGLYSLIMSSKLPKAKEFKRWVTAEVLPTIRKHGAYMTDETLHRALTEPDFLIQLATQLKEAKEQNKALEVKVSSLTVDKQIMQPKADYFDELVDRNLLTGIRETAKELQVKPKVFVNFLLEKKYLYRDNKGKLMPYAKHVETGLFELKEFTNDKTGFSSTQTFITPKGKETFRLLLIGK
ncbi:MAG: phage antirepressor KilAC domain-containing protein [Ruminiclostridium sp.]|nr:phage antirepressor KilAC domain-containing protein [Ruminiclostridium sp.]